MFARLCNNTLEKHKRRPHTACGAEPCSRATRSKRICASDVFRSTSEINARARECNPASVVYRLNFVIFVSTLIHHFAREIAVVPSPSTSSVSVRRIVVFYYELYYCISICAAQIIESKRSRGPMCAQRSTSIISLRDSSAAVITRDKRNSGGET